MSLERRAGNPTGTFDMPPNEPQEIERKFLVNLDDLPKDLDQYSHARIDQGYIRITEEGEIRVRRKTDSKGETYTITRKEGTGMVRREREHTITWKEAFNRLWLLTRGQRIEKTRYKIPYGEYTIELDVYEGKLTGRVVAEIEFSSVAASEAFTPPDWFGKDVTKDKRYKNQNLATKGWPQD